MEKVRYFSWITQFSVSRAYMRWEVAGKSFNVIASLLEKSLSTIFHKHENVGYNACADQLHSIRLLAVIIKCFLCFFIFLWAPVTNVYCLVSHTRQRIPKKI